MEEREKQIGESTPKSFQFDENYKTTRPRN